MKNKYDELLSKVAINVKLRPHVKDIAGAFYWLLHKETSAFGQQVVNGGAGAAHPFPVPLSALLSRFISLLEPLGVSNKKQLNQVQGLHRVAQSVEPFRIP